MPVIEHYETFGKVAQVGSQFSWQSPLPIHPIWQIDSSPSVDKVHAAAVVVVVKVLT